MAGVSNYSFCSVTELMIFGDVKTANIEGRDAKVAMAVCVASGAARCNGC